MLLHDFATHMSFVSPHLTATLTVEDFVRFISLASEVQHRAGTALRLTPKSPPVLPFLSKALDPKFPTHLLQDLWSISFQLLPTTRFDPVAAIRKLGLQSDPKIAEQYLRAPVSKCLVCPEALSPNLHLHSRLNGYLYNTDGVHPVQTIILDCPRCGASYRPSYYTHTRMRHYYTLGMGRDVDILHVHCHYYITNRLAHMLRVIQMLAHVSHFNLTNWFNEVYVENTDVPLFELGQVFSPAMSEVVCLDGLELRDLLAHQDRRQSQLVVPANGTDDNRFDEAIAYHLDQLDVEGTRFRDHYCSKCVRVKSGGVDPGTGEEVFLAARRARQHGRTPRSGRPLYQPPHQKQRPLL
ncbi:uncharacterized protein MELLADRAFT_96278 [Melampsora larici-populina 98AG31]|uniref:CxC5 like cysteine cluster associated with KDZ domain-containing protein n=1 Tax=Melampsora larici-populina (strain 98AG31 / pathotype 3-4-7) TaxID=747676 RepID=F4RE72_MELLP|nr:uncharacterized protein MELLADRAFT_96278 [Melampsora larici-populina 98AG31]EGG09323.1 hypothetical protein MELLADRAFT_96278 [Melampsora larici-populina 98AG31]